VACSSRELSVYLGGGVRGRGQVPTRAGCPYLFCQPYAVCLMGWVS